MLVICQVYHRLPTCLTLWTAQIECQQAPVSSCYFHLEYSGCREKAVLPCRVHALFHTDKICCEPLTEWLPFADLAGNTIAGTSQQAADRWYSLHAQK